MRLDKMLFEIKRIIRRYPFKVDKKETLHNMAVEICLYVNEIQYEDGKAVFMKILKMIPDVLKDDKKKDKK